MALSSLIPGARLMRLVEFFQRCSAPIVCRTCLSRLVAFICESLTSTTGTAALTMISSLSLPIFRTRSMVMVWPTKTRTSSRLTAVKPAMDASMR